MLTLHFPDHTYETVTSYLDTNIDDIDHIDIDGTFLAEYNQSKIIRDTISYLLQKHSVTPPWDRRFALITDELVNNSIEHGSMLGDTNSFTLRITRKGDAVTIEIAISDHGHGHVHKTAEEMETIRKERMATGFKDHISNRGRGLFMIICRLVDNISFQDNTLGGLTVSVQKTLTNV